MKNVAALALFFLLSCIYSCGTATIACQPVLMFVACTGFTNADFSKGYILYTYKKDNAFDSLIDSSKADNGLPASGTLLINSNISNDYDYKLVLPAINATYNITTITLDNNKTEKIHRSLFYDKVMCFTQLASYSVNSTAYTSTANPSPMAGDTIYVRK